MTVSLLRHSNVLARSLKLNPNGWSRQGCRIDYLEHPVSLRVLIGPQHTLLRIKKTGTECFNLRIGVHPFDRSTLVFRPDTFFPDRFAAINVIDPSTCRPHRPLTDKKVRRLPRGQTTIISLEFDHHHHHSDGWPIWLAMTGHPGVQLSDAEWNHPNPTVSFWVQDLLKELRIGLGRSLSEELWKK